MMMGWIETKRTIKEWTFLIFFALLVNLVLLADIIKAVVSQLVRKCNCFNEDYLKRVQVKNLFGFCSKLFCEKLF